MSNENRCWRPVPAQLAPPRQRQPRDQDKTAMAGTAMASSRFEYAAVRPHQIERQVFSASRDLL